MDKEPRFAMKIVARRTGLTPHVIRIWERRYGVVKPYRSATNRRLYSEKDIQHLKLLQRATQAGHGIGQIADLEAEELRKILRADESGTRRLLDPEPLKGTPQQPEVYLRAALEAIKSFDVEELTRILRRAEIALTPSSLLEAMLLPLMVEIGRLWRVGSLRVVNEHLASSVVRSFLGSLSTMESPAHGPGLVVATPAGQLHEFGAMVAAATAKSEGFQVVYLGPNLPSTEIAAGVRGCGSDVVALSIVYPPDDPLLVEEFKKMRQLLPDSTRIVVGGRASDGYSRILDEIGASRPGDMTGFRHLLESFRLGV